MGSILPSFPTLPSYRYTITLDGVQYRIRLQWRARLAAWYVDLFQLDETPLLLGRRLSPRWDLLKDVLLSDGPPGALYVRAPDVYERDHLGQSTFLIYYPEDDLPEAASTSALLVALS